MASQLLACSGEYDVFRYMQAKHLADVYRYATGNMPTRERTSYTRDLRDKKSDDVLQMYRTELDKLRLPVVAFGKLSITTLFERILFLDKEGLAHEALFLMASERGMLIKADDIAHMKQYVQSQNIQDLEESAAAK